MNSTTTREMERINALNRLGIGTSILERPSFGEN
jgi:hypothetical protein